MTRIMTVLSLLVSAVAALVSVSPVMIFTARDDGDGDGDDGGW